jgi:hypothetical protein
VGDVTVPIPSGLALDPSKTRVFYDISHEMVFKDFSPGGAVDWTMTQIEAACIRKLKKAQSTSAEKRTLCISTDHDTQAA